MPAQPEPTRAIAHRFANAIVERLGGGLPGIAESRIYFCKSARQGYKEIWVMDYDGGNQRPITQYGSLSLTPAVFHFKRRANPCCGSAYVLPSHL